MEKKLIINLRKWIERQIWDDGLVIDKEEPEKHSSAYVLYSKL